MKKYLFSFAIVFFVFGKINAQLPAYVWANSMGGVGEDIAFKVAVDDSGNTYLTGHFTGQVDFDPGNDSLILTSVGDSDIFVAKYESSGLLVWAFNIGGTTADEGLAIAVDHSANVWVSGYFSGANVDFDPDLGTTTLSSAGNKDCFFAKYDSSGVFQHAFRVGGTGVDMCNSIAIDESDNLVTTGSFATTVDFNPDTGITSFSASPRQDIFVAKYTTSGSFIWAFDIGGSSFIDAGLGITTDDSSNIVVTGYFESTNIDFDPGAGSFTMTASGGFDAFVAKYDSSKGFRWAMHFGATSADKGYGVATDTSGSVFICGQFAGANVNFNPSGFAPISSNGTNFDIYVAKYDSAGIFQWVFPLGGTSVDNAYGIIVGPFEDVYVCGYFNGTADFDPGTGSRILTSIGSQDAFIAEYNTFGNYHGAFSIPGSTLDVCYGLASDPAGNLYATGYFTGTADFDPGAASNSLSATDSTDIFLAKYAPVPVGIPHVYVPSKDLKVFPNPAQDNITVNIPETVQNAELVITDVRGREIRKMNVHNRMTSVDIKDLKDGLYFLSLYNDSEISRVKFTVTK